MVGRYMLRTIDELLRLAHGIQTSWQAVDGKPDERLATIIEELEEARELALRSRSRAAEGIKVGRRLLRGLGIKPPAMPRPRHPRSEDVPTPLPYTIEYLDPAPGPCIDCGAEVPLGPVGWAHEPKEGPLCDACLRPRCPPLSVVLLLANMLRELGGLECASDEEQWNLMASLLTAGRTFEAGDLASWVPFPALPESELEKLLTAIAYRNEIEEKDEREPTGVH